MKALTIKELHQHLAKAIKDGLGDKLILLSGDDEGNYYHEMFYAITKVDDCVSENHQLPYGVSLNNARRDYIILG